MLGWISRYSSGVRLRLWLSVAMGSVRVVCGLWFVWSCKRVIDVATGATEGSFWLAVGMMATAITAEILMGIATSYIQKITAIRLQNRLRGELFRHLLGTVWNSRDELHSGDTMNRLERDIKDITEFISTSLPTMIYTLLQFGASFLFLTLLDGRLAWALIGIVPFFLLISKLYYGKMRKLTHNVRSSDSRIQAHLQESIQNRLVIKTHNASRTMISRLDALQTILFGQTLTHTGFSSFSRSMISLGFACGYTVAFVYGAGELMTGAITYGVMTAFLQLVGQMQRPIVQLSGLIPQFIAATTASDRLDELKNMPSEKHGEAAIYDSPCGIRLQNITFRYENGRRKIFDGFSADFAPGSRTAVLGETGAGKSTLLKLILALAEPESGSIEMYDHKHSTSISPAVRPNFIYVPQGNTLFSGTIRDNLLLGDNDASDEMMRKALHTSAADFVTELPDGLNTICGEGGATLSEGQAQRIAIARALLGKGSIMLLDEVTSALDIDTEKILISRLSENYPDKTMIFITHRTEIANICNRTIYISRCNAI